MGNGFCAHHWRERWSPAVQTSVLRALAPSVDIIGLGNRCSGISFPELLMSLCTGLPGSHPAPCVPCHGLGLLMIASCSRSTVSSDARWRMGGSGHQLAQPQPGELAQWLFKDGAGCVWPLPGGERCRGRREGPAAGGRNQSVGRVSRSVRCQRRIVSGDCSSTGTHVPHCELSHLLSRQPGRSHRSTVAVRSPGRALSHAVLRPIGLACGWGAVK